MDLDKALQFVENYARGYVLYLLAFFGEPSPEKSELDAEDPFKTIVLFSLLSAYLGAVFSSRAISGLFPHQGDLLVLISQQFAYWMALAFVLYVVLRLSGAPKVGLEVLLTVLTVTPVAYAIAGYGSYLVAVIGVAFVAHDSDVRWPAYLAELIIQLGLLAIYFPRYLSRVKGLSRRQTIGGSVALVLVIVVVQVFYFAEGMKRREDALEAASAASAAAAKAAKPLPTAGAR
jgi:hypothetical protein